MSTTETLRTQLDALRTDYYQLETENRRLREAKPQESAVIEIETELTQTHEENVRLVQEISRLQETSAQPDTDRTAHETLVGELRETIATMEGQMTRLRGTLEETNAELEEGERTLERLTTRAQQAEEETERLGSVLEATRSAAELERQGRSRRDAEVGEA